MTTKINVTAHPFLSGTGKQLEVVIESYDNGVLNTFATVRLDQGQTHECMCYEGRKITITESIKEDKQNG